MSVAPDILFNAENIPPELRGTDSFVLWDYACLGGKWTKVPAHLYGTASTTTPSHWLTFDRAVENIAAHDGIGLVMHAGHRFGAIDIDGCVAEDGAIDEWAWTIVEQVDSYTEYSPTRRGLRIFTELNDKRGRTKIESAARGTVRVTLPNGETVDKSVKLELFAGSNYVTMTGHLVDGAPGEIANRQSQFDALWQHIEDSRPKASPRPSTVGGGTGGTLDDDEILAKLATAKNAAKFRSLFDRGDRSAYGQDESRADSALAGLIGFYTRDVDQVERIMRRSALARDKWDRRENGDGYLRRTIINALGVANGQYEPRQTRTEARKATVVASGDHRPVEGGETPSSPSATSARAPAEVAQWVPFPIDQLPPVLRDFAREADAALQVESAFVVLPLLTALGAAIGNTARVLIKSGFVQPSLLWSACVATSGSGKSPALAAALAPVHRRQMSAVADYNAAHAEYQQAKAKHDALPKGERAQEAEPTPPTLEHLIISDSTTEAIAVRLWQSPRGLLCAVDELAGMLKSFNSYKRGGNDREAWLSMYDAGFTKIDRKTSIVATITIPAAFTALTGGVQPGVLAGIFNDDEFDSGLAARFMFALPPNRRRRWNEDVVADEVKAGVDDVFAALYAKPLNYVDEQLSPRILPLSDDARRVWGEWFDEIEDELAGADDESPYGVALPKVRSVAARIALILQLVSHVIGEKSASDTHVDGTSMRRGVAIARWFRQEQRRVYGTLAMSKADRLLLKLVAMIREMGGAVTVRDWQRKRNAKAKGEAEAELQTIVDANLGGWVYEAQARGGHTLKSMRLNDTRSAGDPENAASVSHSHSYYKSDSPSLTPDDAPVAEDGDDSEPSSPMTNDTRSSGDSASAGSVSRGVE